jgi:hypothetical protein
MPKSITNSGQGRLHPGIRKKSKIELYILLLGFHEGYGFTIHHRILASPGGG